MGEHKFSQIMSLLHISRETEIDKIPPKNEKSEFS